MRALWLVALLAGAPSLAAECAGHLKVIGFRGSDQALIRREESCGAIVLYRLELKTGAVTEVATLLENEERGPRFSALRAKRWAEAQKRLEGEGFVIEGTRRSEVRLSLPGGVTLAEEDCSTGDDQDAPSDRVVVARKGKKVQELARVSSSISSAPVWLDELRASPDGVFVIALIGGTITVMQDSVKVYRVAELLKE